MVAMRKDTPTILSCKPIDFVQLGQVKLGVTQKRAGMNVKVNFGRKMLTDWVKARFFACFAPRHARLY